MLVGLLIGVIVVDLGPCNHAFLNLKNCNTESDVLQFLIQLNTNGDVD